MVDVVFQVLRRFGSLLALIVGTVLFNSIDPIG